MYQQTGAQGSATAAEGGYEDAPAGAQTAEPDDTKVYQAGKKPIPDESPETPAEGEVVDEK